MLDPDGAAQIAPEIEKQLGIRLTVDHSPFRRCYVKADAQEAEQLLFHLLSNALRAVSPGGRSRSGSPGTTRICT